MPGRKQKNEVDGPHHFVRDLQRAHLPWVDGSTPHRNRVLARLGWEVTHAACRAQRRALEFSSTVDREFLAQSFRDTKRPEDHSTPHKTPKTGTHYQHVPKALKHEQKRTTVSASALSAHRSSLCPACAQAYRTTSASSSRTCARSCMGPRADRHALVEPVERNPSNKTEANRILSTRRMFIHFRCSGSRTQI